MNRYIVTVEILSRVYNTTQRIGVPVHADSEAQAVLRALATFDLFAITRPLGVRPG